LLSFVYAFVAQPEAQQVRPEELLYALRKHDLVEHMQVEQWKIQFVMFAPSYLRVVLVLARLCFEKG